MIATKFFFKWLLIFFWIASGINHFRVPDFYINIMPLYMPLHRELVLLSGLTEIIAGVMVAVPALTRWGAWFILAHLAIFMTVHVDMIANADRYPDIPLVVLWIRIPVQALFALWAYWFTRETPSRPVQSAEPQES